MFHNNFLSHSASLAMHASDVRYSTTPKTNHNIIKSRPPIATICLLAVLRNPSPKTLRWCHLTRHLNWSPPKRFLSSAAGRNYRTFEVDPLLDSDFNPSLALMIDDAWNTSPIPETTVWGQRSWSEFFAANYSLTLENTCKSCCNLEVWKVVSFW